MTQGSISFPWRLSAVGEVSTVPRGSDAEVDEAIAVLLLTQPGERRLTPDYGTPDPAYAGLSAGGIQIGLDSHGPLGIRIDSLELEPTSDTEAEAVVRWSRQTGAVT